MSDIEKTKAAPAPKMFKVTIHSGEDKGDKGDVPLVHNYKQILIKRDVEVTISEHFLECLEHSVVHTTVKGEEGQPDRAIRIPRFSYSSKPA